MESTVVEVGISADARVDIPQNQTQNFVEALNSAFSAALRQNGHPNFTVVQLPALLRVNGQNQAGGASGQSESRPSSGEEASATASNANSNATSSNSTAASSTDTSENESNAQQGQQQNSSPGGSNGYKDNKFIDFCSADQFNLDKQRVRESLLKLSIRCERCKLVSNRFSSNTTIFC